MADTIDDPMFGHLTWDDQLTCWLGGVDLFTAFHVEVTVSPTEEDRLGGLPVARESLEWLRSHEGQARRHVASEMLELYNDSWRDEDEPLTEDEFLSRIELLRASFGEDGSVLLSYDGGAMFGYHLLDADFGPDKDYRGTMMIG